MKKIFAYYFILSILVLVSCVSNNKTETRIVPEDKILALQWNKAYEKDSLGTAVKGLEWALSHVGAKHTKMLNQMISGDKRVILNSAQLGFNKVGVQNLMLLHHKLKATEEYKQVGAIDIGRYTTLLIGASEHYYKLVQIPDNYFDLLAQYNITETKGYVNNSVLTKRTRVINFSEQEELKQLFVSEEIDEHTGEIIEYETVDIMPNGQLRFGIFDVDGKRKSSTDPLETRAGKPGKCMWCHESKIQPLFNPQIDYKGYLTAQKLSDTLQYYRESHIEAQKQLTNGVDYTKTKDHAFMEILYTTFMEPSAERLSLEWGIPIEEVKRKLSKLTTHIHPERGEMLGLIYHREEVEPFAPFTSLPVSSNVREKSLIEVNHLN